MPAPVLATAAKPPTTAQRLAAEILGKALPQAPA